MDLIIAALVGAGLGTLITIYVLHSPWRDPGSNFLPKRFNFGTKLDFWRVPSSQTETPVKSKRQALADKLRSRE